MPLDTAAIQTIAGLYQSYQQPLLRYLEHLTHDHAAAEDLLQETFLKALEHWQQLNSVSHARGWLFRIATNRAYSYFRRQHNRTASLIAQDIAVPTTVSQEALEVSATLQEALGEVPERYRIPLLLHSYAGLPITDIAAALHCSVGTVKSRLFRARAYVRKQYAHQ